ncbi:hypothetical protein KV697_13885 [Sphingomonas sanguinis]|uniref:hypothetical protein n=1 Tax=Sphingomonas sanguinis TaxID=33051 RepID=UPI001C57F214|nr:hypothetical protein [Sphingomonas sanguinis]QXT34866.1 hypothetical protein KV697_13885 [Sphingomonas sanguinis]
MDDERMVTTLGALAHETRLAICRILVRTGVEGMPAGGITERFHEKARLSEPRFSATGLLIAAWRYSLDFGHFARSSAGSSGDKIEMAGLKIRVILHEREPPSLPAIYILIGAAELQQGIPEVARSLAPRPPSKARRSGWAVFRRRRTRGSIAADASSSSPFNPRCAVNGCRSRPNGMGLHVRYGASEPAPRSPKRNCVEARTGTREERRQREQRR